MTPVPGRSLNNLSDAVGLLPSDCGSLLASTLPLALCTVPTCDVLLVGLPVFCGLVAAGAAVARVVAWAFFSDFVTGGNLTAWRSFDLLAALAAAFANVLAGVPLFWVAGTFAFADLTGLAAALALTAALTVVLLAFFWRSFGDDMGTRFLN